MIVDFLTSDSNIIKLKKMEILVIYFRRSSKY